MHSFTGDGRRGKINTAGGAPRTLRPWSEAAFLSPCGTQPASGARASRGERAGASPLHRHRHCALPANARAPPPEASRLTGDDNLLPELPGPADVGVHGGLGRVLDCARVNDPEVGGGRVVHLTVSAGAAARGGARQSGADGPALGRRRGEAWRARGRRGWRTSVKPKDRSCPAMYSLSLVLWAQP